MTNGANMKKDWVEEVGEKKMASVLIVQGDLKQVALGVFHLPKNSGNSGRVVNGTRLFGSFRWKFSGINGIPEKVVPFSRWKFPNGKFVFHLQIYCLITSSMPFAVY